MLQQNGYYVVESPRDFEGFDILYIEFWKEGVRRVWMQKENSLYAVYSKVEHTRDLVVKGENNAWKDTKKEERESLS